MRGRYSDWQVHRTLGAGDFATVYHVCRGDEEGALKHSTPSQSARERLRLEHDALIALSHPSIPRVLDADFESEEPWFVMSLAPGESVLGIVSRWEELGRVHGPVETVAILAQLVSALQHMQETCEFVHRDIKDANVIIDHSSGLATLIDFGFCKRAGVSAIRDKDSFWRAGAARFSPPGKLEDPALAVASHDVFALGVLAYRLLTGMFPWTVSTDEGLAAYRKFLKSNSLVLPHEISSLIPLELSRLVSRMLVLNDEDRITTAEAKDRCEYLRKHLSSVPITSRRRVAVAYPHVVRDPVRGDIRLTDLEYRALNTREMQRLRWIRQLGLTNLVYPGADHSRLSHSIGSLERAESMLRSVEMVEGIRVDPDIREEVRLFALLHDFSHIAAGHTIEDQLGFFVRHDKNLGRWERLLCGKQSELGGLLESSDAGRATLRRMNPSSEVGEDLVKQVVSGPIGADVLDYLDRDAYYCGLDHRADSALFRQLKLYSRDSSDAGKLVSATSGKYGIRVDREYAVESLLSERYAMFLKVYTHTAKIAADVVLGKALAEQAGPKRSLKEPDFEWFGDEGLLNFLGSSRKPLVAQSAMRLRERTLPRGVFRSRIIHDQERLEGRTYADEQSEAERKGFHSPAGRKGVEGTLAKKVGIDPARVYFYFPINAPGYSLAEHWVQASSGERPHKDRVSGGPQILRRHLRLWECWVFLSEGSDSERRRLAEAAEDLLQLPNMIEEYRRVLL
ncbi:MAG: hypothetical protein EOL89_08920 [Actinobacteria bacterium]|nr:hypothetical protein [Actinomycetota bacterium]